MDTFVPVKVDFSVSTLELTQLLRELKRGQATAVETLLRLMQSKDDRVALQAATNFLKTTTEVATEISKERLTRLIAQAKELQSQGLLRQAGGGSSQPLVDFDTVDDAHFT